MIEKGIPIWNGAWPENQIFRTGGARSQNLVLSFVWGGVRGSGQGIAILNEAAPEKPNFQTMGARPRNFEMSFVWGGVR